MKIKLNAGIAALLIACLLALGGVMTAAAAAGSYITLEEFLQVRDLSSLAAAPDGRSVAVRVSGDDLQTNRRIEQWYVVALDSAAPAKLIADAGEPDWSKNGPAVGRISTEPPQWSPDSKWLYYRAIQDGQVQVWRVEVSLGSPEQLTHDPADVEHFAVDWQHNALLYTVAATRTAIVAAEQAEYDNGVLLDETVRVGEPLVRNHPLNGRPMTYRQRGTRFVTLLDDHARQLQALDLGSGTVAAASRIQEAAYRSLTEHEANPGRRLLRATRPSGGAAVIVTDEGSAPGSETAQRIHFLKGDSPSSADVPCADIACSNIDRELKRTVSMGLSLIGWSSHSSLVFRKEEFRGEGLYVWDTAKQRVRNIVSTTGALNGGSGASRCALAGNETVCVFADANQAPRLDAISLSSGKSRVLFDPNPNVGPDRMGRFERLVATTEDGGLADGYLMLPRGYVPGERVPLVITDYVCHGFIRPEDDVSEHMLAAAGMAAFCMNDSHRAKRPVSTGAGSDKLVPVNLSTLQNSLAVRKALVLQLTQRGIVDPKRVALAGMSAGAGQVMYSLIHSDAFVAGMISTSNYHDPISYHLGGAYISKNYPQDSTEKSPFDDEYFAPVSPALNARGMPPLLMQSPDREYMENMQLLTAMSMLRRPVEMIVYPDEFHIKVQPRHRLSAYRRGADWFRFWLQGYEDPDPAKREQYVRWRKLRELKEKTGD